MQGIYGLIFKIVQFWIFFFILNTGK